MLETFGRKHVRMGDDPSHSMNFSASRYLECLSYLEKQGIVEMVGIAQGGGGVYILRDSEHYSEYKKQQSQNISQDSS